MKDIPRASMDFREQTARQSQLPGITTPSFYCTRCKQTRLIAGRVARVPGYKRLGYVCAQCNREKKEKAIGC